MDDSASDLRRARGLAREHCFREAEALLARLIDAAEREGDKEMLTEARRAAREIAETAWPRWRRRFSALAGEPEAHTTRRTYSAAEAGERHVQFQREVDDLVRRWAAGDEVEYRRLWRQLSDGPR